MPPRTPRKASTAPKTPAKTATTDAPAKAPKMPEAGPETVRRFDELAEAFVARGAKRSQMFGMPVLKAGGKVFAGTFGDLEKARKQTGVEPFEPVKGRAMKEWVLVPLGHAKRWSDLAERAFSYVS